ncbi:MAG: procyclic acidic repetitive family protein [Oscillospiraceae bacterium]|jgi:hypothetical protein|nr:procyclic acidic repetitive family protein [Oscillospiraceae bacterium]
MLTSEQIGKLKQKNISVDGEKTAQRTQAVWKAAKSKVKQDALALGGFARSTVYRVFQTGTISAKLVIPIAQLLNVDPFYLTGESDEQGAFSEELLNALLQKHGYTDLLPKESKSDKPKRKYERKQPQKAIKEPAIEPEIVAEPEPEIITEPEVVIEPETVALPEPEPVPETAPIAKLSAESLQALLTALTIRADAGVADAADQLAQVQAILLR